MYWNDDGTDGCILGEICALNHYQNNMLVMSMASPVHANVSVATTLASLTYSLSANGCKSAIHEVCYSTRIFLKKAKDRLPLSILDPSALLSQLKGVGCCTSCIPACARVKAERRGSASSRFGRLRIRAAAENRGLSCFVLPNVIKRQRR